MFGYLQHVVWFNNMWGKNMPTWEKEMAPWPWSEKGVVEVVSMMAWDGAGLAWLSTGPGIARASWNMPPIFWNSTIFTQSIFKHQRINLTIIVVGENEFAVSYLCMVMKAITVQSKPIQNWAHGGNPHGKELKKQVRNIICTLWPGTVWSATFLAPL